MERTFTIVLEPDAKTGVFTALVPAIPGVVSEGDTVEEAMANVREAIELTLEDLTAHGEPLPDSDVDAVVQQVRVSIPAA
ncbi:MAG TPA: type II toxin-antitoxin system HicB family antitoxin [Candidatus Baltobacteraceae bacterium]|nr:type II toxin-antitoxin system HicB family antitoxin [Candidatus Baltobacteraceae bacterium]